MGLKNSFFHDQVIINFIKKMMFAEVPIQNILLLYQMLAASKLEFTRYRIKGLIRKIHIKKRKTYSLYILKIGKDSGRSISFKID